MCLMHCNRYNCHGLVHSNALDLPVGELFVFFEVTVDVAVRENMAKNTV